MSLRRDELPLLQNRDRGFCAGVSIKLADRSPPLANRSAPATVRRLLPREHGAPRRSRRRCRHVLHSFNLTPPSCAASGPKESTHHHRVMKAASSGRARPRKRRINGTAATAGVAKPTESISRTLSLVRAALQVWEAKHGALPRNSVWRRRSQTPAAASAPAHCAPPIWDRPDRAGKKGAIARCPLIASRPGSA